ncbi:hypothetical protein GQ44DRAFT_757032 [Phaeosphaeriaceae sp. PMI808]|nr:hypothetical protein GQ44DRAFT_757032 [Phaeosphaeriaceae sp. PMI808]
MPDPSLGKISKPKSLLDFQRVFSPTAGVRVFPLYLGAINFGDAWEDLMGKCDKTTTFQILDYFHERGGNFIDTSGQFTAEQKRGRKMDHLKGNIEALGINLSDKEVEDIDSAAEFDIRFPMNALFEFGGQKYNNNMTSADVKLLMFTRNLETPSVLKGPKPHGLSG